MKKVAIIITVFILCMLFSAFVSSAKICDVDRDGTVSAADARLTLRAAVGLEKLDKEQQLLADADLDGNITAADARLVLRTSVGLEGSDVISNSYISVTIPEELRDSVQASVNGDYIKFKEKTNAALEEGYYGSLFSINIYETDSFSIFPAYEILGVLRKGDEFRYIIATLPTDCQFKADYSTDISNRENKYEKAYYDAYNKRELIYNTIKGINGWELSTETEHMTNIKSASPFFTYANEKFQYMNFSDYLLNSSMENIVLSAIERDFDHDGSTELVTVCIDSDDSSLSAYLRLYKIANGSVVLSDTTEAISAFDSSNSTSSWCVSLYGDALHLERFVAARGGSTIISDFISYKIAGGKLVKEYNYNNYANNTYGVQTYEESVSGRTFNSYDEMLTDAKTKGFTGNHTHMEVLTDNTPDAAELKGNHIVTILTDNKFSTGRKCCIIHNNIHELSTN